MAGRRRSALWALLRFLLLFLRLPAPSLGFTGTVWLPLSLAVLGSARFRNHR